MSKKRPSPLKPLALGLSTAALLGVYPSCQSAEKRTHEPTRHSAKAVTPSGTSDEIPPDEIPPSVDRTTPSPLRQTPQGPVRPPIVSETRPQTPSLEREEEILETLRQGAIAPGRTLPRVVYTWTTREQVHALHKDKTLLRRSRSPEHGIARYSRSIQAQAARGERIARLLQDPVFARQRFAWSHPWATLRGWGKETYGDQLVRVTLRDDAVWASMRSTSALDTEESVEWSFFDLQGRTVNLREVLRAPERLVGVYHTTSVSDASCPDLGSYAGSLCVFREFVLINPHGIARWEVGTREVVGVLHKERDLFRDLLAITPSVLPEERQKPRMSFTESQHLSRYVDGGAWSQNIEKLKEYEGRGAETITRAKQMERGLASNLALINDLYSFNRENYTHIMNDLDAAASKQGTPLVVDEPESPKTFPKSAVRSRFLKPKKSRKGPAKAPRKRPKFNGTY